MNKIIKVLFEIIILISFNYLNRIIIFEFQLNKYVISDKINIQKNSFSYNIEFLEYSFSFKYNLIKIKFGINFHDQNNNLIKPSDLSLYHKLSVFCHMKQKQTDLSLNSLANIKENNHFYCIEYIKIKEPIQFGFNVCKFEDATITENNFIYFYANKYIDYNNLNYKIDNKFNILLINKNHKKFIDNINTIFYNSNSYKLKKSYLIPPYCQLKREIAIVNNKWLFANIFNNFFCFCKGMECTNKNINQKCKYKFYLSIIDDNKNLYKKTDILLSDFFTFKVDPVDGFPIFKEMINQNLKAHYMTIDENIYNNFLNNDKYNYLQFPIIYEKEIDGNFLEKYLEIILRLKVVLSISNYLSIDNLFFNIQYITYIFLGHGTHYFKEYLYNEYHGIVRYDKIVLPPSKVIINIAKKYGWKKRNIIKICLPRYDIYNYPPKSLLNKKESIFLMFTWRKIKEGKHMSELYYNNIINLLTNIKLNEELNNNNVILYYSYHHSLKSQYNFNLKKYPNIKKVNNSEILPCLKNSRLLITDFSSIVFDFIYQKKPFILFIPDLDDPNIKELYIQEYYDIINGLKNNSIYFENKFFELKEIINKIIYYIHNNFTSENKLKKFYKYFNLNSTNNTYKLINYIKKMK